ALYGPEKVKGQSEDAAIDATIYKFFDEASASACLASIDVRAVTKLLQLPPGDDRFKPIDPKYRKNTRALAKVFNTDPSAVARLSALVRVVYQVRCNMFHGDKDPASWRDKMLVTAAAPIAAIILGCLSEIMEKHP